MSLLNACALLGALCATVPQDAAVQEKGKSTLSFPEVVARLRAQAGRLQVGSLSGFLSSLLKEERPAPRQPLSRIQLDLVRDTDGTTRSILSAWLVRGLDQKDPPGLSELKIRLAESAALRDSLTQHAEAIVREGILTPEQSRAHAGAGVRQGQRPLVGRYSAIGLSVSATPPPKSLGDCDFAIRTKAFSLTNEVILAKGARPLSRKSSEFYTVLLDDAVVATVGISSEQIDLVRAMDKVTRRVLSAWLMRGLEPKPPVGERSGEEATPPMLFRLSDEGARLQASVLAHSEAIVTQGALGPDGLKIVAQELFVRRGVRALLDPPVACWGVKYKNKK
jgi:hypothetical protein